MDPKLITPAWVTKTIIVTDQDSRLSKAITFKNVKASLGDLALSSSVYSQNNSAAKTSVDTFSLMGGSAKEGTPKCCPASLFYQTLIAVFAEHK